MEALVVSTFRAIRSLFTPGMLGVFLLSIAVTFAALTGFVALSSIFFTWLADYLHGHIFAFFLPWLGSIGSVAISWFLFPGIMPVIISFFDDRIARVIESHDYPSAIAAHKPAFWLELFHDMKFTLLVIGLNVLMLPVYILSHVFSPFLFYLLNGYLLGREFFVMVARRHMPSYEAEGLRHRHGRIVWIAGTILAVLATIPMVNFFAPFWGIAVMVHLYHAIEKSPAPQILLPK